MWNAIIKYFSSPNPLTGRWLLLYLGCCHQCDAPILEALWFTALQPPPLWHISKELANGRYSSCESWLPPLNALLTSTGWTSLKGTGEFPVTLSSTRSLTEETLQITWWYESGLCIDYQHSLRKQMLHARWYEQRNGGYSYTVLAGHQLPLLPNNVLPCFWGVIHSLEVEHFGADIFQKKLNVDWSWIPSRRRQGHGGQLVDSRARLCQVGLCDAAQRSNQLPLWLAERVA